MKPLHQNVLVEETLTKNSSPIIMSSDEKPEDENVYTPTLKVLQVGPDVPKECKLKTGDIPCISKWSEPSYMKIVKGKPGDLKIVRHVVYDVKSIVAID